MMGGFTNINPRVNPADQKWLELYNKFNQIMISMFKTMDSFRLTEELQNSPLYKDSKIIKNVLEAYKKTTKRSLEFFERELQEFKDFNFILPSMRKDNKTETETIYK